MRHFMGWAALAAGLLSGPVLAQESPVVVELFTSQGCSSCPPADAILAELAMRDDVIALALHVDYWDYIGWKDQFAMPGFTERQQGYARVAGERVVYTPQMVIGGVDSVIGTNTLALMDAISAHAAARPSVRLSLTQSGGMLHISAEAVGPIARPMTVQLVRFDPEQTVEIHSGENAGLTVRYVNVVTFWDSLTDWDGAAPLAIDMPLTGPDAVAVIVQQTGPGLIIAAARLR